MFENIHLNTIINSSIIYLFIVIALRVFGKKELAQLSVADLVFVLLISNAVQNSMVGSDDTLIGGILAATSLFCINKLLKFLLYKSEKFHYIMEGEPVILIRHGKLNKKELEKNRINLRELKEACRENGTENLHLIDLAILEVDGKISIIEDEKLEKGSKFDVDEDAF